MIPRVPSRAFLVAAAVLVVSVAALSCVAEWDVQKTQPPYADRPAYVHWPAPYRPVPSSSRMPVNN